MLAHLGTRRVDALQSYATTLDSPVRYPLHWWFLDLSPSKPLPPSHSRRTYFFPLPRSLQLWVPRFFWVLFSLFTALPAAYGSSWARRWIGAAAASPQLCPQQRQIQATTATCAAETTEQCQRPNRHPQNHYVRFITRWTTMGTPEPQVLRSSPRVRL